MPWFKVDDMFFGNRKVVRIPRARRPAAIGLWTLAGTWAANQLTDGFIPAELPAELGATKRAVDDLVAVNLWEPVEGGWQFHDWHHYQPTKADVVGRRTAHAEKMRDWRESKRQRDNAVTRHAPVTNQPVTRHERVSDGSVTSIPTRPDPYLPTETSLGALSKPNAGDKSAPETILDRFDHWCETTNRPRPTRAARDTLAHHIGRLLDEHIPPNDIEAGLHLWRTKGTTGAAALPQFVDQARAQPTRADDQRAIREDRLKRAGDPTPPPGLTGPQEREWLRNWRTAIANGQPPPEPAPAEGRTE